MGVGCSSLLHLPTGCPPRALRQAAMLWPPPPDPVASTPSGTQRPSNLFLCKKKRGWSMPNLFRKTICFQSLVFWKLVSLIPPHPWPHEHCWNLKSKRFHWSAYAPLCADCSSVQLNLRVGELKIQSVNCSSPWLSFWLWELCLTLKGHVHNLNTDLRPNLIGRRRDINTSCSYSGLLQVSGACVA